MTLLIGERYRPKLAQSLGALRIEVLWLPENAALDPRLSGHADLSVFVAGNTIFAAEGVYPRIVNNLTNRGYTVISVPGQGRLYPADVPLCICATGRYTIYNPRTACADAVAACGGVPVPVRQGYARCAACVVDDHSIITADASVSSASKKAGLDVLDIAPGHIALDGYDTGFIGGASFILNDDTIAFTGTLDGHPDKERMLAFLAQHGKKAVFLTAEPIFDIGGAISV